MNLKDYLFMDHHFRNGFARPRVKGGFAIMMDRLIITHNLDEVEIYFSRFTRNPHYRRLAL